MKEPLTANIAVPDVLQEDINRAVKILKEGGCTEIYLFGSGVAGKVRHGSDVDLAVRGCPQGHFFHLLGRLGNWITPLILSIWMRQMPLPNTCKKREYCSALADNVVSQVTFEIGQIDQLLAVYADLVERVQQRPPDLVEMTAMASVLHSFYNGLENIFLSISYPHGG